ncbi:hypothetical protein JSE7799_01789 [Jannaschia seosinensis]|uniref:Uncharacterized protein n=1 Tax=Jannaschia seosinensis TaxID=313367 RepID=A0A0M7B8M9_9RHOB|nr:TrgA family protein [Jannaschia seosinensis]CUH39070.1 hypothetical protein JSE7799_01789 [Jannaschia seosinensis]
MPTPAKLVAAVLMAALAWYVCEIIVREVLPDGSRVGFFREVLPDGSRVGFFREIAALGALVVGWKVIGRPATGPRGRGGKITEVLTAGIGAAIVLLCLGVVLHSFVEMITVSLSGKYTQVGIAMNAWLGFLWDDVQIVMNQVILAPLLLGAVAVGLISGVVGRVWH